MPGDKQNENMHWREEEGERPGGGGREGERKRDTEKAFLLKTSQLLVPALCETQVCTLLGSSRDTCILLMTFSFCLSQF